jgi:hydroxyacylglutathione hydrolase
MSRLAILPVECLEENYAFVVHAPDEHEACVVDPSEAEPILRALSAHGDPRLRGVLATHHHRDHVDGLEELISRCGTNEPPWVAGHARDRTRISGLTHPVDAPVDRYAPTGIELAGVELFAMHVPGHTRGAIAWCVPGSARAAASVFTGDTLFAGGCGRLFEGTAEQMYASLRALVAMPDDTLLWFGHEYTAKNLEFAASVEPENRAIERRRRALGPTSVPTTVGEEKATNPFVRASSVEEFARRRLAKDRF